MSTQSVPQAVLARLRKLVEMRVDRGCTPAEAGAAAAAAERLLEEYQLSIADIGAGDAGEPVEETIVALSGERIQSWVYDLAGAVSRPHGCEYVVSSRRVGNDMKRVILFIGHSSDAQHSRWLYEYLQPLLWAMADAAGRDARRRSHALISFRYNFMTAAAHEVQNRLSAERLHVRAETPGRSDALVKVKGTKVADWLRSNHPRIRTVTNIGPDWDQLAQVQGREAGSQVPLNRPLDAPQERPALPGPSSAD